MMFVSDAIRVILATVHVALADVPRLLTREVLESVIRLSARELPRFGFAAPRLALAGLNPHAGERGVIGPEEGAVLAPAVEAVPCETASTSAARSRPTPSSSAPRAASSTPSSRAITIRV